MKGELGDDEGDEVMTLASSRHDPNDRSRRDRFLGYALLCLSLTSPPLRYNLQSTDRRALSWVNSKTSRATEMAICQSAFKTNASTKRPICFIVLWLDRDESSAFRPDAYSV